MDNGGLRYGAVEGALRRPLPTATQSALHDPTIPSRPPQAQNRRSLDRSVAAQHHPPDPRKRTLRGRHQIGIPAGFKSELVAGFLLELVAGFVVAERPLHYTKRARRTDPSRPELCSRSLRFLCAVPRALATCHVKPTLTLVRGLETKQESRRKRTSRPRHASNLAGALNEDGR